MALTKVTNDMSDAPDPAEILTAIKTVDGSTSGLDADLLDGQQGAYYTAYADTAISNLVDSSPASLNTLNELAAALGDDVNFSTTVTDSIATKAPLASPTFTGTVVATSLDISGNIDVDGTTNLDVVDIDGAVDMASTLAVGGVVTANAGVVVDNITIDGTQIDLSSGDLTLDVAGDIILDADGADIRLKDGGTQFGKFTRSSGDFIISASETDKDMKFAGADGASDVTALTLDMSAAGAATFNSNVISGGGLFALNGDGTYAKGLTIAKSGEQQHYIYSNGATQTNAIGSSAANWVWKQEGGANKMTLSAAGAATLSSSVTSTGVYLNNASNGFLWNTANGGIQFGTNNTERMRIDSSGNVLVGQTSASSNTVGTSLRQDGRNFYCADGNYSGHFNRKSSDGAIVHFAKDDANIGSINTEGGDMAIGNDDVGLQFINGGKSIRGFNMTTNARADAAVDLGMSSTRFKDLYLSSGVFLGGTGAANKLSDYEEVNFTATIRGSSAEPSTLVTVGGFATKIGRVVQYSIGFEAINTTGYSGNVSITGLPFTNNGGRAMGNLVGYIGLTYVGTECFTLIGVNSTILEAMTISSNSAWGNATHNAGTTRYFWLTGTYMTTA